MLELKEGVSHPLRVLVREIQSSAGATGTLNESSSQPVGVFSFVHDPPTVSGMFVGKTLLPPLRASFAFYSCWLHFFFKFPFRNSSRRHPHLNIQHHPWIPVNSTLGRCRSIALLTFTCVFSLWPILFYIFYLRRFKTQPCTLYF